MTDKEFPFISEKEQEAKWDARYLKELRDMFAGQVVAALVTKYGFENEAYGWDDAAMWAYGQADAMLAERAKEGS